MAQTTQTPHEIPHLKDDVERAKSVLLKLTSSSKGKEKTAPLGSDQMPKAELHFASGLAFTTVSKGGIGLSFEHGRGFIISKLPGQGPPTPGKPATPWSWSAPLFIKVNAASVGATIGYSEIDSFIILDTPEAVNSFKKSVVEVNTDLTAAAGSTAAASLPATAVNLSNWSLSDREFAYSIAKGALVDVSLAGVAYTVDEARNKVAYGEFSSPSAILEGGVPPPDVMRELYEALDGILKEFYVEQQQQSQERGAAA